MVDFTKRIKDSDKFRGPALEYIRSGVYCSYPKSTTEYIKFWETEMNRCVDGYTADDGDYITGYNYFYLNYCPILRIVNTLVINKQGKVHNKRTSELTFPDFYDYDYYYFQAVHEAEIAGKHITLLKSRRKGFSYKGGSMACRNYYLIPSSKTYIYASNKQYLTEDGILTKAWEYMDFIDKNTAWGKKRTVSTTMRRRAAYIITDEFGNKIECGYKSEIIGVSLKDNPDALRGKRAKLILFEEGGTFSELGAAWQIARPSVEQDGITFGLMIVWGTGGDEGSAFATLKDMFYHPDGYNCLGFPNIWDDGITDTECGFFVPQYTNLDNRDDNGNRIYMDKDGNTLHKKSLDFILDERKKVTTSATSTVAVDRYVAERPITPREAMLEFNGNIFPKKDMQMHLSYIRTNKKLQNQKHVGDLVWEQGIPTWIPKKTGDITHYPLNKEDDPTGSIVIWEHPMKEPPSGLYIAGCLTPGEKVITEDGLKNVEDVTLDDRLINKDGKFVIINTLLRFDKVDEPIYKIEMSNVNRSTTYTQEHPLYVANNIDEEFNFIKASEVKVGMWNKYPNIYNKELEIPFSLWDKYETGRTNHFNPMNEEDFWWFVGHWLGDGFNHQQGNNYTIYNSFGLEETEYVNKYKFIVNKLFNRKPNLKLQNGSNTHKFECKQLYLFLEENFGRYADGKYISEWIKYLPVNLKKHLMLGYLDADGSIYLDKTTIRCSFKSINKKLLDDTQDILFSLGIVNSFNFSDPAGTYKINGKTGNTKQSYAVRVCQSDLNKFGKLFDSDHNSRKLRLAKTIIFKQKPKLSNTCIMSDDNKYIYIKIKNIEESIYTGTIYNFDCETHSFISQYCTGHNCDPYDHDQSGTNSLGSTFIYKRIQSFEEYYEMPVAEYTGRPETAEEYYENVRKLLVYYNARLLYENERKGIFPYFTSKHCDYLLADQPDIIRDIVGKSSVNRQKGIHMSKPIKDWMEGLVKEWLCEEYAPGKKNLTKILSEPLLEELISYNDTANFDRVISFGLIMIYREQLHNIHVKEKKKTQKKLDLFGTPIFGDSWFNNKPDDSIDHDRTNTTTEEIYTF